MHGIDMGEDQDAPTLGARSYQQHVGASRRAGNTFHVSGEIVHLGHRAIDHAIHRGDIARRALDLDPAHDALDQGADVNRSVPPFWHFGTAYHIQLGECDVTEQNC